MYFPQNLLILYTIVPNIPSELLSNKTLLKDQHRLITVRENLQSQKDWGLVILFGFVSDQIYIGLLGYKEEKKKAESNDIKKTNRLY